MISAVGTAPINGPNTGMMFVTATITLTSTTYGMPMIAQQI